MVNSSRIPGFYKKNFEKRVDLLVETLALSSTDKNVLLGANRDEMLNTLDGLIENVIGMFPLPVGIATNFIINDVERLIPMATEEPSVVAAASNIARIARKHGGFKVDHVPSMMIGQVQLLDIDDNSKAVELIQNNQTRIITLANKQDPVLVKMGGGAKRIESTVIETSMGPMLDVHLIVDCLDAMGANAVNTMAEAIAPVLEEITGGRSLLRIISNLAVHRLVRCKATFDRELLGGIQVVDRILEAVEFAKNDIFRAATHNKGIMNGISAVVRATGNDTRAIEAGAHAYAAWKHPYRPLSWFYKDDDGNLVGELEVPVAVGTIGGATKSHPMAQLSLKIMEVTGAETLAQVIGAVGLAQNVAALRALASEGIQQGHMKLHAKNIVKMADIPSQYREAVIEALIKGGKIRVDIARSLFDKLSSKGETE